MLHLATILRRPGLRLASAACFALLAPAVPAAAQASAVRLQQAVGAPIAATNRVCTAEPRALLYGTQNYKSAQPLTYTSDGVPGPGYWVPANAPSAIDLVPALMAGERSDLCVGFTLPPAAERSLIRDEDTPGDRVQDPEPWPDLVDTHVAPGVVGDPAPQGDDPRSFRIDLPAGAGLALAPQLTCSDAQFRTGALAAPQCPAASQIGDALVRLSVADGTRARHAAMPDAKLFLLPHGPDELARIGLATPAPRPGTTPYKTVLRVTLLAGGRLRLVAADLPRAIYATADLAADGTPSPSASSKPVYVESFGLRLYGSRADHANLAADLASTATTCDAPAQTSVAVRTYEGAASDRTAEALTSAGCGSLDYAPALDLSLTDPRPGVPTGATFSLQLRGGGAGRVQDRTSTATIALPGGLHLGEQLGGGAPKLCTVAAFARESSGAADCPAASRIGSASIATALVGEPLTGGIHLSAPRDPGDLAALLIEAAAPGATADDAPRLKLVGRLLVGSGGQLTIRFDDLPVVPIGTLALSFTGGDHALLTTPTACGPVAAGASFASANGVVAASTSAPVEIDGDCAAPATEPTVVIRALNPRPGSKDGLDVTVGRPARAAALTTVSAVLPEGALLDLRGRATCTATQVEGMQCADTAALGRVRLVAGAGAAPVTLEGPLFQVRANAGTLAAGMARLQIALGDLALGEVSVPVAFAYDGRAHKLVVAANVPTEIGDLPLDVRSVGLELASGLTLNPSACGPLPVAAEATTEGGASGRANGSFSLDGCSGHALAPSLKVAMSGESTVGGHPGALVSLGLRDADTNLGGARFTLPAGLTIDTTHATCDPATFANGTCGDTGRIGSVVSTSSLEPELVGGELSLVREPGRALPSIGFTVGGIYGFRTIGQVSTVGGRLVANFDDLPDAPLTRLDLVFDGGKAGGLKIASSLCSGTGEWRAEFTGQAGQTAVATSAVPCGERPNSSSAGPVVALSMSAKTGLKLKVNAFGGRRLQSAKLTLPSRLTFITAAARKKKNASIVVLGATARTTFSASSIAVTMRGSATPQEVVARVRWPAMTARAKGPRTARFRLRLGYTDGTVQRKTVAVKLPAKLRGTPSR